MTTSWGIEYHGTGAHYDGEDLRFLAGNSGVLDLNRTASCYCTVRAALKMFRLEG